MLQFSTPVNNARLDAIESTIGTSPILTIRTGPPPANCAAANSGVVLATLALPSDWMAAAANAIKAMAGSWADSAADANGFAGHFRIHNSGGTVCGMQGNVAQMWLPSVPFAVGQQVTNGGNTYRATAAGTSAASGGPTGTGGAITDGGVTWAYVGTTDMILDNTNFASGQPFDVTAFSIGSSNV